MNKKYYDGGIVTEILLTHLEAEKMLEVLKAFADVKGVDAVPVVHGHWIRTGEDGYCSVCNCDMPMFREDWEWKYCATKYCPNCGARMDKE